MAPSNDSIFLSRLGVLLNEKGKDLARLLRSLTAFGPRDSMKPSLFRKFIRLLDQVADAKKEENALIGQIEAVEQKHRFARKLGLLRHASAAAPMPALTCKQEGPGCSRPRKDLLWLLMLWYLFARRPKPQK